MTKISSKNRPPGSNWGDWGDDDKLGHLNYITDEIVLEAIKEVKVGKRFCLSLPLDYPGNDVLNSVRKEPILKPIIREKAEYYNFNWQNIDSRFTDIASDDSVLLDLQFSTQWDGLCHRGEIVDVGNGDEPLYYNGHKTKVIQEDYENILPIGIEHMASSCVQGRGILIDLKNEVGTYPRVEINHEMLISILDKQNINIKQGDILCFWTGLDELILSNSKKENPKLINSCAVLDGWDHKLLDWIKNSKIAAIVSDNLAIEAIGKEIPADHNGSYLPLHNQCLFKSGIHLGSFGIWLILLIGS